MEVKTMWLLAQDCGIQRTAQKEVHWRAGRTMPSGNDKVITRVVLSYMESETQKEI